MSGYSRYTSKGAVFTTRIKRTINNLFKKPVFEEVIANWIDQINTVAKQHNIEKHSSFKLTAIETSLKKNEAYNYRTLCDKKIISDVYIRTFS